VQEKIFKNGTRKSASKKHSLGKGERTARLDGIREKTKISGNSTSFNKHYSYQDFKKSFGGEGINRRGGVLFDEEIPEEWFIENYPRGGRGGGEYFGRS